MCFLYDFGNQGGSRIMITRGRPTLYKPENADLARKFCMLGATNQELAECFEVSRSTIDHWIESIPEFAEGVRQGRTRADADAIDKFYSRVVGHTHDTKKYVPHPGEVREPPVKLYYPPDIRGGMFWLRNRRRRHWGQVEKEAPPERGPDLEALEAGVREAERLAAE